MKRKTIPALLCLAFWLCLAFPAFAADGKVVFMSDLHMNLDAPYSWLDENIGDVADFINRTSQRSDVSEFVILGDLLDDWVYPMTSQPYTDAFYQILNTEKNGPIVSALQNICANEEIRVTYVTGNHDMLSFEEENKAVIQSFFPEMEIVSNDPGLGYVSWDDVALAEHGHRYCLFNAPDTWSRAGGHLPLGYFITRAVADNTGANAQDLHTPDLLANFIAEHGLVDELPKLVYEAVALYTGHHLASATWMNGLDNYDNNPLVSQVADTYAEIMAQWDKRQNTVDNIMAAIDDMGTLYGAALHLFNNTTEYGFTPRVVIMGHTHKAAFSRLSHPQSSIYANTGTWIDGKDCTWVELDVQSGDGWTDYGVSLWYYNEAASRHEGTVRVAAN